MADSIDAVEENFQGLNDGFQIPNNAAQIFYGGQYKANVRWSSRRQRWTWAKTKEVLRALQSYDSNHLNEGCHPARIIANKNNWMLGYDVEYVPVARWRFRTDQLVSDGERYPSDTMPGEIASRYSIKLLSGLGYIPGVFTSQTPLNPTALRYG